MRNVSSCRFLAALVSIPSSTGVVASYFLHYLAGSKEVSIPSSTGVVARELDWKDHTLSEEFQSRHLRASLQVYIGKLGVGAVGVSIPSSTGVVARTIAEQWNDFVGVSIPSSTGVVARLQT